MRLLYLRIFKTTYDKVIDFENKDLNFGGSRKFTYTIDDKEDRVFIKENQVENYVVGLYGKIDVRCLVGKNGSGKTTLLQFLQWLMCIPNILRTNHSYDYINWEFTAIMDIGGKLHYIINPKSKHENLDLQLLNKNENWVKAGVNPLDNVESINAESILYSPHMEFNNPPSFHPGDFIDVSTNDIYFRDISEKEAKNETPDIRYFRQEEIKRQIIFINHITRGRKKKREAKDLIFLEKFVGNTIYVEFKSDIKRHQDLRYIDDDNVELYNSIDKKYFDRKHELVDRVQNRKDKSEAETELATLCLLKRIVEIIFDSFENYHSGYPEGAGKFRHTLINVSEIDVDRPIVEVLGEFIDKQVYIDGNNIQRLSKSIDKFKQLISHRSFNHVHSNSTFTSNEFRCDLSTGKAFIELETELLAPLDVSGDSIYAVDWPGLSTGERGYLNLFSRIYKAYEELNAKDKKRHKSLFFLIDEPATGFHPQWQKEYFKMLLSYLEWEFEWPSVSVIIATHSPYVLSNFQKNDVVVLAMDYETQEEDYNKQLTFGANIHELLANKFFLQNGFIDDFARDKINEVIDYLTSDKSRVNDGWLDPRNVQSFIQNIGEPLIQDRMQQIYNEKFGSDQNRERSLSGITTEELREELKRRDEENKD